MSAAHKPARGALSGPAHRDDVPASRDVDVASGHDEALQPNERRKAAQAFRTIAEVSDELGIAKHVLRFWELKFTHLRPMKRGGGRRFYRPDDVELLRGIHYLLQAEAFTIKGVQKILREQGAEAVKRLGAEPAIRPGKGRAGAKRARRATVEITLQGSPGDGINQPAAVRPAAATRLSGTTASTSGRAPASDHAEATIRAAIRELEAVRAMLSGPDALAGRTHEPPARP